MVQLPDHVLHVAMQSDSRIQQDGYGSPGSIWKAMSHETFVTFRDTDDLLGECANLEHPGDGSQFSANSLESQMQLGTLQYPRYPMASDAELRCRNTP